MTNLQVIARDLSTLGQELDEATEAMITAEAHLMEAKHEYEIAFYTATLKAEGKSAEDRKADAWLATQEQKWDLAVSEQVLKVSKGRLGAIQTRIEIARSLSAMTRSEMALGGFTT